MLFTTTTTPRLSPLIALDGARQLAEQSARVATAWRQQAFCQWWWCTDERSRVEISLVCIVPAGECEYDVLSGAFGEY